MNESETGLEGGNLSMERTTARDEWNERYSTSDYVWTDEANQFVESHLGDLPAGQAIDLAAGEGRNAVWLASRGWQVIAVDFSKTGLEKAARLAADHGVTVDFVEADATEFQPSADVDLVVISYLQLGTDDRQAVLERAKTWLKPGGTLFIVAHDRSNVTGGYGGPSSPDVCYTAAETVDCLDGLEIGTAICAERIVSTDAGDQTALDTLVIARRPAAE